MAKGWLNSTVRSATRRRVRTLTNNPERGSSNFSGFVNMGYAKRGIRRLMKRDESVAQGTPDDQILVGTSGVAGRTGASSPRIISHTEDRTRGFGTGQRVIKDRGQNKRLRRS
jgi:hypothetical protein